MRCYIATRKVNIVLSLIHCNSFGLCLFSRFVKLAMFFRETFKREMWMDLEMQDTCSNILDT